MPKLKFLLLQLKWYPQAVAKHIWMLQHLWWGPTSSYIIPRFTGILSVSLLLFMAKKGTEVVRAELISEENNPFL
jgi:hypothetical protein